MTGNATQASAGRPEVLQVLRRGAAISAAATTGLFMVVTLASVPAYAQAPALEQGDFASAVTAAKKSGQRVKITDATTETSEYYANPDGKITGVISAGQARFRRNGSWVPVDLTLQRQADGSVVPKAHPHSLRLSGARADAATDLASLGTGPNQVAMGWQGALPQPRLEGNKATYADVRPGIDVVVQATATGFEQFTVVKSANAAKYIGEINLPLSSAGAASVAEDARGRVRVHGADGRQRAEIPTPMMWDSRATRRGVPNRRQVATDVVAAATPAANARTAGPPATTLSLKPDQKWLTSPDTVYPVTIDPYVDWSTTAASTTVVEGYPTGWPDADSLFVGSWDGVTRTRSYITWWANRLQGMHIDSATAYFVNPYSNSCTPTPFELWTTDAFTDDTSWTNQPTWRHKETTAAEATQYDEIDVSFCADGWINADATSFFQRAASNNVATPTMGLRAVNETDASQYKQFWSHNYSEAWKFPYVEVMYSVPTTSPDPYQEDSAVYPGEVALDEDGDITFPDTGELPDPPVGDESSSVRAMRRPVICDRNTTWLKSWNAVSSSNVITHASGYVIPAGGSGRYSKSSEYQKQITASVSFSTQVTIGAPIIRAGLEAQVGFNIAASGSKTTTKNTTVETTVTKSGTHIFFMGRRSVTGSFSASRCNTDGTAIYSSAGKMRSYAIPYEGAVWCGERPKAGSFKARAKIYCDE